jgi:tellurite resistance protein
MWVPQGCGIRVGPYWVPGGMVYVGPIPRRRPSHNEYVEVIDGRLPVHERTPDFDGQGMGYWPAYHSIPPESRAAYLAWLAGGRVAPQAYIGYVFLFFYGLERRALVDARTDPQAMAELPGIRAEVVRLLVIYGGNNSFRSYSSRFVQYLDVLLARKTPMSAGPAPDPDGERYPTPMRLQIGIGEFARDGRPVPAEWAYSWARLHPETHALTRSVRCPVEFRRLFVARYVEQFGDGMVVRPLKRRLEVGYRPASAGLQGENWTMDVPDVVTAATPTRRLVELLVSCADDLAPYSRLLARNPDAAGTVAAVALLPDELLDEQVPVLQPLRCFVDDHLGGGGHPVVVMGDELAAFWPPRTEGRFGKADAVGLAQLLGRLGIGVEPDVRMGGPVLDCGPMVLFRLGGDHPGTPSHEYSAATVLLHLAVVVTAADDDVTEQERRLLVGHLESALQLSDGERTRLVAHMTWLLATGVKLTGLKKRLATLTTAQRGGIAEFVALVAAADGTIAPQEVTALRKIYTLLELDPESVYGKLHALSVSPLPASQPVTVRHASGNQPAHLLPPPPGQVRLDPAVIQAKLAESAAVSALLSDIFVGDEPVAVAPPPVHTAHVHGLDGPHSTLLRRLVERSSWTRPELEGLCDGLGLLPDGALDTLNEVAMDVTGEPVIEDGALGQMDVNSYASGELLP